MHQCLKSLVTAVLSALQDTAESGTPAEDLKIELL